PTANGESTSEYRSQSLGPDQCRPAERGGASKPCAQPGRPSRTNVHLRLPNHTTFYRFFGAADDRLNVQLYHDLVAPHLDAGARAYWEGRDITGRRRISRFARNFYRYGLLGRFIATGHLAARVFGANPKRMLEARTIEEQQDIFAREIAPAFDHPVLRWITSNRASLFGLGIPPVQYDALSGGG